MILLKLVIFELFHWLFVLHSLEDFVLDLFLIDLCYLQDVRLELGDVRLSIAVNYPHCDLVKLWLQVHHEASNQVLWELLSDHRKHEILPVLGTMGLWHFEGESCAFH